MDLRGYSGRIAGATQRQRTEAEAEASAEPEALVKPEAEAEAVAGAEPEASVKPEAKPEAAPADRSAPASASGRSTASGSAHATASASASGRSTPSASGRSWEIPVLQTIADKEQGITDLVSALDGHRTWLQTSGELTNRRRTRLAERVREQVARTLQRVAWQEKGGDAALESSLDTLVNGDETPYDVAARIVRAALANETEGGNAPPGRG